MSVNPVETVALKPPMLADVEALLPTLPDDVENELANYEAQIRKYLAGEIGETKMQKLRLHFGTYAQRQEGVQMQRIKIPGGFLSAEQLTRLADAADRFGSNFIHFTTREDAQLYYVRLEEAPALLRFLAAVGITTREACGNTVRNITACYRAGVSHNEAFNVLPYAEALFRFLVRHKQHQNLGRKFKITFEGCAEDHSALRIHDLGFWAVNRIVDGQLKRGFKVYMGGGLGGAPHLAHLYTEFLPVEELFNLTTAVLRVFDRYGERKSRMKARMKFLIQTMGWEAFLEALENERELIGALAFKDEVAKREPLPAEPLSRSRGLAQLDPRTEDRGFRHWVRAAVVAHKVAGFRGVQVRIKLGDITAERARQLADVAQQFSAGQLRVSIEQNLYLPWAREEELFDLYLALKKISLVEIGAGTVTDVTTCPGSDTCRLGIASAKGLGSAISEAFDGALAKFSELARPLRVKISGCPNGCAQHAIADIGFHAAAFSHQGRTVPAHLLFVGGQTNPDSAQFGRLIGKFPARRSVQVIETLLQLYQEEGRAAEDFNAFAARVGDERLKAALEPLRAVPDFADDPTSYQDYGHENERFAIRQGVKGECAGATVAEAIPTIEQAKEGLAQAEALLYHKEYEQAQRAAYEAAAAAARVPLYERLVDPFTSEEALWEFENLFVLSGLTHGAWANLAARFAEWQVSVAPENVAQERVAEAREFVRYCATFSAT
ncbi:MAG: nitrite/sulfite reductase [Acidobacteria bacterium]|nr:nitrite/sulfite reductase [Acidobacteriota bacterium]